MDHVPALYEEIRSASRQSQKPGNVRIFSQKLILVPAMFLCVLQCSVRPSKDVYQAMVEELDVYMKHLPKGLMVAPTHVSVDKTGRIPVQVAQFSDSELYLQQRTPVAVLSRAFSEHCCPQTFASDCEVSAHQAPESVDLISDLMSRLTIGENISDRHCCDLRELISRYSVCLQAKTRITSVFLESDHYF